MRLLGIVAFIFILITQWFVFMFAPVERSLGVVQKIFYLHMPMAWWSFVGFFGVFVLSCAYLIQRKEKHFLMAGAFGEIGVVYCTLMLITGIFWARASWNTWWTWDPRLTTALIMWFSYTIYLILRKAEEEKLKIISSCLGIVAFVDVPLVFIAARLWRSIHPSVFSSKGGLDPDMKVVLFLSLIAWGLLFVFLSFLRYQILKLEKKEENLLIRKVFESFDL